MADANWGVSRESGEKVDESLIFTKQMAALYNKKNYDGKDRVLEICYTDLNKTYQITLTKDGSQVLTDGCLECTTRIDTPDTVWQSIAQKEIRGDEALAKQLYTLKGDFSLMLKWDTIFGPDDVPTSTSANN
ncbi:MAG: SCP2 sterol-binding domain-containing protein, partial [Clostridia bacterium]|nr:SCP2 sterol-binding domain-containing protein [Clostridia bacterium]